MQQKKILGKLSHRPTSAGPNSLPVWVLKSCSVELAEPICHVLNLTFSTGKLHSHWLESLVTPGPKVSNPN
jgi:hypothetical protein